MAGWLKNWRRRFKDLVREIDRLLGPDEELVPVPVPVRTGRRQVPPRR